MWLDLRRVLTENRNVQLLMLQAVVTQLCFGMFMVIWQPYIVNLGASFTQLGLIQVVIAVFTSVGSLVWGRLADMRGRKPAHIGTVVCRFIAMLFAFLSKDWTGFLGFGVFIGLSASWTQSNPVTTTYISESVEEDRMSTALSLYTSAGTLIAVVAAPLGGVIAANAGYNFIFVSCLVGELVNSALAWLFMRETLGAHQESVPSMTTGIGTLLLPERELLPFYLVSTLTMVSWRIAFSNLNAILVHAYGLTTVQLGLMASAFSLSYGLSQAPLGVVMDRHSKKAFFMVSRLGFLAIALGYILFPSFPVFILLQVINGVSHSFGVPSFIAMILARTPRDQRSTVMGKLSTLPQIFSIPAPLVGGYIYERVGFDFLLYIRIICMILSVIITFRYIKPVEAQQPRGSTLIQSV
jgi:MFS family permease